MKSKKTLDKNILTCIICCIVFAITGIASFVVFATKQDTLSMRFLIISGISFVISFVFLNIFAYLIYYKTYCKTVKKMLSENLADNYIEVFPTKRYKKAYGNEMYYFAKYHTDSGAIYLKIKDIEEKEISEKVTTNIYWFFANFYF